MAFRSSSKGMTLFLVIMLLSLLGTVAFYIHSYSRRQLHQSGRIGSSEVAYQVAEFGAQQGSQFVRKAIDFLNSTAPETFAKNEKVPPALRSFFNCFVNADGRLSDDSVEMVLPIVGTPLAEVSGPHGEKVQLEVKLKLDRTSPLLENERVPGLKDGQPERRGRFVVDSSAHFRGVRKRVVALFEQRTVQLQIPVLGRFSLAAGEILGVLNPVKESLVEGLIPPRASATKQVQPLILYGGPEISAPERAAAFKNPETFLDRQGWVFLGTPSGNDPEQITLGVAPGDSDYGEEYLLRGKSLFIYDITQGAKIFGLSALTGNGGPGLKLWETHQRYACLTGLYKETKTAERREIMLLEPRNTEQSSIIRCMGNSDEPSPTLVFGKVYRSYILERGIRRKPSPPSGSESPASAAALPFIPYDRFTDSIWPGTKSEAAQILKESCGNDWNGFSQGMTSLIVSPYNEGLAYFFDSGRQNPKNSCIQPTFQTSALSKLGKGLKYSAVSPKGMIMDGPMELHRGSRHVFTGEIQQVLPNIGSLLLARCGREVSSTNDLLVLLKNLRELGISSTGFYHVKGPFAWTDEFNKLALGGVGIVADGDIRISEGIKPFSTTSGPDLFQHRIILASLQGSITISTTKPLHAALAAPNGELRLDGAKGLKLTGTLAVRRLNVDSLASREEKFIRFDPAYDWADPTSYAQSFRVMLEHQPLVFQAKQ